MLQISDYKVVSGYAMTLESFNNKIKELLKESWQPLGSVVSTQSGFYQTMVKYSYPSQAD